MTDKKILNNIFKVFPTPGLLLLCDAPNYTIAEVNEAYLTATATNKSDLIGKSIFEAFPANPDNLRYDISSLRKSLDTVVHTAAPHVMAKQKYVTPITHNNESITRYWETENIPVANYNGEVCLVIHSITDVTQKILQQQEHKKLEDQTLALQAGLQKAKTELDKIMDISSDVICAMDNAGNLARVSAASAKIWGYTPEELIGKPYMDFVCPEDCKKTFKVIADVMSGMHKTTFENRCIHKNGSLVSIIWSATWAREENIMYCIARDATKNLQNETAIIESEKKYKRLFESNPSAMLIWDVDTKQIIDCNKEAVLKYGYARDEFLQLSITALTPAEDSWLIEEEAKVENVNSKIYQKVLRHKKKNGELMFVEVSGHSIDYNGVNATFAFLNDVTEKLKAEERNKFKAKLLNTIGQSVIATDLNGQISFWNKAAQEIYGWTPEEAIGKNIVDLIPATQTKEQAQDIMAELLKGGSWSGEFIVQKKCGTAFPVFVTDAPIYNDLQNLTGIIGVSTDITERRKTELLVTNSGRQLETIYNTVSDIIFMLSVEGNNRFKYVSVNHTFLKATGLSNEQVAGKYVNDVIPAAALALVLTKYNEAIISRKTVCWEETSEYPSGIKTGCVTVSPVIDENGNCTMLVGSVHDITDRKKAEEEIKQSNQRYDYVTKATSDAIWDWDLLGKTIQWGEGFQNLFGYDLKEITKSISSWTDNIHPDDIERVTKGIYEMTSGNSSNWGDEYRFRKKDQTYAYVTDKGFVIRDEKGKAIRVVGSMQDVTKKKQEEHHLKLLESVVTNTNDAVLITEAQTSHGAGWRIVYANEAFAKMSGYTSAEVIGKTAGFMQGAKSDQKALEWLSTELKHERPCEITIINYKKNGEEFWNNVSINPVADHKGRLTHFIAIERDVTQRKNDELQKMLLAEISSLFNESITLNKTLLEVLKRLVAFGDFSKAEAWLVSTDQKRIDRVSRFPKIRADAEFCDETAVKSFSKGHGLPGITWQTNSIELWQSPAVSGGFSGNGESKMADTTTTYGVPIVYNNQAIGVFIVALKENKQISAKIAGLIENLGVHAGAEIRRKQLEQDLSQIFKYVPDIICISSNDGYFKKVNQAMCRLLEYSEEELLSIPYAELVHPHDKDITLQEVNSLTKGNPTFTFENRYISKSGKIIFLSWTAAPSPEKGLMFGVARDITEKKELENQLNKTSGVARIGGWELDVTKMIIRWSGFTREIHEVDIDFVPDLATGINFYKEGPSRDLISLKVSEAINNGTPWDEELQIITARGNECWVRAIGEAECINNKCVKLYGSFQDINVRKMAEIALLKAFEEKNTILESIGDAFFAVDENWLVTYWNSQAEKMLMKSKVEVIGHNLKEVFSDSIDAKAYKKFAEAITTKKVVHFENYSEIMSKWYQMSAYPLDNGLSVYFTDITDRKSSEIRLNNLNVSLQKKAKELAVSNEELEQFAYVASHDLQEPLRTVTSFLTLLEKKYGAVIDEKGKRYIDFAVDGARRMRQIILDLLEFSKVGKTDDKREDLDLNNLIKEIEILCGQQIAEKKAVIYSGQLPVINTYKAPLRQIFHNLIGNALKYTKKDNPPRINITVDKLKDHWQFAVMDNGIGIGEEYLDKIFIIFQRLHNKNDFSGTGIGLAITKKIIENLGGKIWVESTEGKGSSFYFILPRT